MKDKTTNMMREFKKEIHNLNFGFNKVFVKAVTIPEEGSSKITESSLAF